MVNAIVPFLRCIALDCLTVDKCWTTTSQSPLYRHAASAIHT